MQERHNYIAYALELCLSCINPSICADGLIPDGTRPFIDRILINTYHPVLDHGLLVTVESVTEDLDTVKPLI